MRGYKTAAAKIRVAMIAAMAAASVAISADVAAADQSVKIGVGGSNFINLTYFYLTLPGPLGYWKQEGYDVQVFPISGSQEAAQQLSVNNLDFAQMSASVIIQSNTEHKLPVRAVVTNGVVGWGVAVKKDGPIKTVADLKGRNVGIISLSSGGIPLLKAYLKGAGLNPESDVNFIATGAGAQPLSALQGGQVDALMYWSAALVGFQAANAGLTVLRDPAWHTLPDFTLSTSQRKMDEDPRMVEGIARGMAKAMVFTEANPDCVRRIQWKYYPDTKPTGVTDDQAAKRDLALLAAVVDEQVKARELNPDNFVAATSATAFGAYQDFLFDAGILTTKVNPAQFQVGDAKFWQRVNNFDKAAIEAAAKACKIGD
jgi:NitT/TauT family transport system substrate-binding protein